MTARQSAFGFVDMAGLADGALAAADVARLAQVGLVGRVFCPIQLRPVVFPSRERCACRTYFARRIARPGPHRRRRIVRSDLWWTAQVLRRALLRLAKPARHASGHR